MKRFYWYLLLIVCLLAFVVNSLLPPQSQQQISNNSLTKVQNTFIEEFGENCVVKIWKEVDKECGLGNRRRHLNIYQGDVTSLSRWPYAVAVQELQGQSDSYPGCYWHYCGGSLIAPNLVLTAAHCLWSKDQDLRHPDKQKGKLLRDLYVAITPACRHMKGQQRIPVVRYFIPDDFRPGIPGVTKEGGDIAILMLQSSVQANAIPIQITNSQTADIRNIQNKDLSALGWGNIWYGDDDLSLRHLRKIQLTYITPTECNQFLRQSSYGGRQSVDPQFEFCSYNPNADTCGGDSGGPIILADKDGDPKKDVLIGISSWGLGQCGVFEEQQPGVYTNISQYHQWILDIKTLGELREAFLQDTSDNFLKSTIQNISTNTNALQELKDVVLEEEQLGGLREILVGADQQNLTTIKSVQEQLTSKNFSLEFENNQFEGLPQFVLPPAKPVNIQLMQPPSEGQICPQTECEGNANLCCMFTAPGQGEICTADATPWLFGGYCNNQQHKYWIGVNFQCTCKN